MENRKRVKNEPITAILRSAQLYLESAMLDLAPGSETRFDVENALNCVLVAQNEARAAERSKADYGRVLLSGESVWEKKR